jgi:hypothetical protein
MLRIDEAHRGKTVRCPNCSERFVLPREEEEQGNEEAVTSYTTAKEQPPPIPPRLAPRRRVVDEDEDAPPRRRARDEEEPEEVEPLRRRRRDDEDDDAPRVRKRRRKKRRRIESSFAGLEWEKIALIALAGFWLLLTGAAFVFPPLAIGLFALGGLLATAARIWMIVAAFQEDSSTGCLVMFFPWYGFLNVEDRRPLLLFGVALLFIVTGVVVLVISHALGRL